MNQPFRGWVASLSDGNTAFEGQPLPGQRTPWQQLLAYCKERNVQITMLRLQRGGRTVHAINHKGCQGYFHAYEARRTVFGDQQTQRQGIGSIVGEMIYITWIDDDGNVWQDVRPLEQERIHTTLS